MELLSRLLDATRSVRHVPSYFPDGPVPQKCTLLGTYEQMGPYKLAESREFWRQFAEKGPHEGTRTDRNERLCAISLVKRFAWAAFFTEELNIHSTGRRFADTATISAVPWLSHRPVLDPEAVRERERTWSGQWLHCKNQDEGNEDGERAVPDRVWQIIGAERDPDHPALPTYYAVLMLDGDRMGNWLQGRYKTEDEKPLPSGEVIQEAISRALGRFAVEQTRIIVEEPGPGHQGTLVYSGGDDVLAMLPTEAVLSCAKSLCNAYRDNWPRDEVHAAEDATVSAGIAVAHHKEDLRFVLNAARQAEKAAKAGGRNAMVLTVCRRSGEHTTALVPWDLVGELQDLVRAFRDGVTDRWAYVLRSELPSLETLPPEAFEAETRRLIERMDDTAMRDKLSTMIAKLFQDYRNQMIQRERGEAVIRRDFVTLCQSAAFLARGRDDR